MIQPQSCQLEEAADPSTPPIRLHELARNGGAREKRAVAANPNASTDLLVWLARWHWEPVLRNPVLPLLLMEDPNFPAKLPVIALREILKMEEPPREFLTPLLRHPNEEIREAARLHRTSRATRHSIVAEQEEEKPSFGLQLRGGAALAEVVTLGLAPTWLLLAALESSEIGLRMRAAKCVLEQGPEGPLHGRMQLLMDAGADSQLRFLGKGRRDMEPENLALLAAGGPFARRLAARHPRTPADSLMKLAGVHGEFMVRCCAAKNPSTPVPTLVSMAGNHDWRIRQAVAKNRQCPASLLDQLAADPVMEVRAAVAGNATASRATLARLGVDVEPEVRVMVARHSATEESMLHVLKKDPDDEVRRTLAKRREVPVDILRELMRDGDSYVRMLAVRNRAMPGDVDVRLHRHFQQTPIGGTLIGAATPVDAPTTAQEQDWKRLMDLFQRREVTEAHLREAAAHPDPLLRARAASCELADEDLLAQLGRDPSEAVRSTVAANVRASLATRLALAEDAHPQVRGAVVAAPEMPEHVVARLSCDPDENVRWRVAYSRHTPPPVLLRMATEETSTRVLETLCGGFDNRLVPDEVLLRVMERLPAAVKKLVYRDRLTVPVLEALIPRLDPHDRKALLYHQSYAHKNGREVRAIPPHLLLRLCELPPDQKWFAREIRLQVVSYWAVTPKVLESVARAELDQSRLSRQRRAAASGVLAAVARHALAPSHLLAELLWHSCHDVRLAALENPNTPVEARRSRMGPVLQSAGAGSAVSLRLCALSHPDTTQDMLRKAAFYGRWMERFAVAHNPSTTRQVLAYLREDANTAVASAAREQFSLRFPDT